jgi:hypothetical protein
MEHRFDQTTPPSLLWLSDHPRASGSQGLTDQQALDLGLDVLVRALDWDGQHARFVRATLLTLVRDPAVIAYRQAILADLATDAPWAEQLRTALGALLPSLAELSRPRSAPWAQDSPLLLVPPRVSDLELYVSCVEQLHRALAAAIALQSDGLRRLRAFIAAAHDDPEFQRLAAELPRLRAQLDQIGSVTLGINLDRDLRPASATLLDISRDQFASPPSLIQRLLGRTPPNTPAPLTALRQLTERSPDADPLAHDLQKVLGEVVEPVAQALERYQRIHARPLATLEPELALYLGAIQFAQRLAAQRQPTCLPAIDPAQHTLAEAYNPALAIQLVQSASQSAAPLAALVRNPIDFSQGRIVVLTGPNRGGKTTYLRAVGLNQVLFQAGLVVAAASAQLAPVDAILTHFPPVEGVEPGVGRLDDEARRLREMFAAATPASLLLFNEPLTSTGEAEAHALAEDVLRALRLLGARTVYVTHLHALAAELPALNRGPGATVASWVAGVDDSAGRTYRIRPGRPEARSHAATIAEQHGITFTQLARQLAERGVVADESEPAAQPPLSRSP